MLTILIGAGAMTLAFGMIAIRMIVLKNGEFRGTCSSNNPLLADKMGGTCSVCGGDLAKCDNANS